MKTRLGFISNSSSSSFVIVLTDDAFEKALLSLNDNDAKIIKCIVKSKTLFGQKVKVLKEFSDAGGFSAIWGYDDKNVEKVIKKAKIDPDEDFSPADSVYNFVNVVDEMSKKKEWKDKIINEEIGDGG